MIKELIPFLIIGMISATPTKLTAAPLASALEKPLKSSDYFSFSITPDQDSVQFQASDINGKLTLGGEELDRMSEDNYYEVRWVDVKELDNLNLTAINLINKVLNETISLH